MKVIHLIGGGDTGGAKTHVFNLLFELEGRIDVHLFTFRQGPFSDEARALGIPISIIDTVNLMKAVKEVRTILQGQKIDLIHCHGARGNLMGVLLRRHLKAPVLSTVHSDYKLDYMGRPVAMLSFGLTNRWALRQIRYFIGVSSAMTDILIDRNFPAERIQSIYNGIDFKTPLEFVPREAFFKSIGFDVKDDDIVAGIAARLDPVKDIPTLLKAMQIACSNNPKLKLVIAGDGADAEKLKQMSIDLGISKQVCFAGWISDMNSFFNAMDLNLLTSISETFPYVLTEGARMRCATIASRVGGIPVLIDQGKNGFIFEPRDFNALSEYLVRLSTDHELRLKMGEALYQKSSTYFSVESMVEQNLLTYNRVIALEKRRKEKKRDGIIICGAYGYGNAGDDAILKSIVQSVKEMDENIPITVLAKNTTNIKKKFLVNSVHSFDILSMFRYMRKSQVYINGGGSLIQNVTSKRSLLYYLFTLRFAKILGNKVDMYGCGIGPIIGNSQLNLVGKVLNKNVDVITLRESRSMELLQKCNVTKPEILLSSDPALVVKPCPPELVEAFFAEYGLSKDQKYICFMLRPWFDYTSKTHDIAKCADYVYEKYGLTSVFISINVYHDTVAAKLVTDKMHSPHISIEEKLEPEMLISILSHMQMTVSMRLHGLIFSSISGLPLIGLGYDPKIAAFLEYLGYGKEIGLENLTRDRLKSAIDAVLENINDSDKKEKRLEAIKTLIDKESINATAMKALFKSITP